MNLKKLLSIIGVLTVIIPVSTTAVSCSWQNKDIAKTINLKTLITKIDLGTIKTNGQAKPSIQEILNAAKTANGDSKIDWNKISILEIRTDGAVLGSKDTKVYTGTVDTNYKIDKSTDLKTAIKNLDLGTIKTNGQAKPSIQEILNAAKTANGDSKIDWNKISILEIRTDGAVLGSKDTKVYTGTVDTNYKIDKSTDLKTAIKNLDLGIINIKDQEPTGKEIFDAAKKANPDKNINWDKISIKEDSVSLNNATLTSIDTTIYTGSVEIKFSSQYNEIVGYSLNKEYYSSEYVYNSDEINILNWKKYASNWNNFVKLLPTLNFSNSFLQLSHDENQNKLDDFNMKAESIITKAHNNNSNIIFNLAIKDVNLDLNIWHDDNNIVMQWFLNVKTSDFNNASLAINIDEINLIS